MHFKTIDKLIDHYQTPRYDKMNPEKPINNFKDIISIHASEILCTLESKTNIPSKHDIMIISEINRHHFLYSPYINFDVTLKRILEIYKNRNEGNKNETEEYQF